MSGRIRLLLTLPDLSGGGAEREVATLAHWLSRDRFEPHLLVHRDRFTYSVPADVPIHQIRRTRARHTPGAVRAIRRVIQELAPRVVFSQLHYANLLTGSALAKLDPRPRWVCRHTNDPRRDLRGPFALWARRALARADRVLGCCDGVSRALSDHLRLDPARVATLPNAVDVARIDALARAPLPIARDPGAFVVVHAGRQVPQKNQALLLDAFAALAHPAQLWMLGAGPLRGALEARARSLGIADRVHWLGFRENPYPFFRAADVFALSSDHEGLPNVLIEAAVCGTSAVATRCRYGPDELVADGVTGRLVPVGDARAFTRALAELAGAPGLARERGAHARRRAVEQFATRAVCDAYEHLFESLACESPIS